MGAHRKAGLMADRLLDTAVGGTLALIVGSVVLNRIPRIMREAFAGRIQATRRDR